MTIYRTITPEGRFLYYLVRIQFRKDGVRIGRENHYSTDLDEIKGIVEERWNGLDTRYVKRHFEITDRVLWGRRARKWARERKAPVVHAKSVSVNGCRIVQWYGRCEQYLKCERHWGCLEEASSRNWTGWRRA